MIFSNHRFIPDLDLYYNNNIDLAKKLSEEIKRCDCNAIKIAMCVENPVDKGSNILDSWIDPNGINRSSLLFNTFKERLVSIKNAKYFTEYLADVFDLRMVSLYDHKSIEICKNYFNFAKIPSNNLNNFPLIKEVCYEFNNIVLDLKKINKEEIIALLEFIKTCNKDINIGLEFSPARPPARANEWKMLSLKYLQNTFIQSDTFIGLSEHSNSIDQSLIAIGLGVDFIEKGVMPDQEYLKGSSDSAHCIPISVFKEWNQRIKDGFNSMQENKYDNQTIYSDKVKLFYRRDLKKGGQLKLEDVYCKFSNRGVDGKNLKKFIDMKLIKSVKADSPVKDNDVCS